MKFKSTNLVLIKHFVTCIIGPEIRDKTCTGLLISLVVIKTQTTGTHRLDVWPKKVLLVSEFGSGYFYSLKFVRQSYKEHGNSDLS